MDYSASGGLAATGAAGSGALAYTGSNNIMWLVIAAVALIAVGGALLRFVPRKQN